MIRDATAVRKRRTTSRPDALTEKQVEAVINRLAGNERVRRALPVWGRIHIDRPLPFLLLYRRPAGRPDPGADRLTLGGAAYLNAPGERAYHPMLSRLVHEVGALMVDRFGAFLLIEIWSGEAVLTTPAHTPPRAAFVIHRLADDGLQHTVDVLHEKLERVKTSRLRSEVDMRVSRRAHPLRLSPLLALPDSDKRGLYQLGIEVRPHYVNPKTGEVFPGLLQSLRRQLNQALDKAVFEFAGQHTTHQPAHHQMLGRRAMVKAVWEADRRLAAVSNSFDFLYQVTPVNAEPAWRKFKRGRFQRDPVFLYRPNPIDPAQMKRALYSIHIERVEDPTLMHLLLEKQLELDRQLTLLHDRGKAEFLYGSLQLYGAITPRLLRTARQVLRNTRPRSRNHGVRGTLSATEFAAKAREEIAWYEKINPEFKASVVVSAEMYSGLMVSRGRLLIGKGTQIPAARAEALIQHEVGTHLLTYYNGRAQPFKMLYSGLPGYDELQEGLAVLSEYLVGGLGASRLRILAARVVAAHAMADGATFVEVFRMLDDEHQLTQRTAYTVTMRVFRGGGLVKDAVYLRGLIHVLNYLSNADDLERLYIGKIAASHTGVIEELLHRKILRPPPLQPRFFQTEGAQQRLADLRKGRSPLDLVPPNERMRE